MFYSNGNCNQEKCLDVLKQQDWFREYCESKPNKECIITNLETGEVIRTDKYGRTPDNPDYMDNKCPW